MNDIWNVTENGYVFSVEKVLEHDGKSLLNELEMLYAEDLAEKVDENNYLIKHEIAASFTSEQRYSMQLPDILPYTISIKSNGINIGKNNFRYIIEYKNTDGTPLINPTRIETYVKVHQELHFMLNLEQYQLVKSAKECNDRIQDIIGKDLMNLDLRNLAKIKELCAKVDAEIEERLKKKKIVVADKLSVNVRRIDEDTIEIEPVLLSETTIGDYEKLDSSEFNRSFNKQGVESGYLGKDGVNYVVTERAKEALEQIKKNKTLRGEKAKRFLLQPKELLDAENFELTVKDPEYNWDGAYSDRVTGIVDYKKTSIPLYKPDTGSWLPEEGESGRAGNNDTVSKENAAEVQKAIDEAQLQGETTITLNGEKIFLTPSFIEKVKRLLGEEDFASDNRWEDKTDNLKDENISGEEYRKKVLGIRDNFENLDYVAKATKEISVDDYYGGLLDSIKLFEHQREGIKWIFECCNSGKRGALVADDMGLGKTMQALAFISAYKKYVGNDCNSVLVVAPVALLKNWYEEYHKFVKPGIFASVEQVHSDNIKKYKVEDEINLSPLAKNRIVLTTYETLRDAQLSFGKIEWSIIIADEAQKIKNPTIITTRALKAMRYGFAICLTGTPVENSWIDLWSIMDFAVPGNVLSSISEFNNTYTKKLKTAEGENEIKNLAQQLEAQIKPYYIRRMKNNTVPDLPKKHVYKRPRNMPEAQSRAYDSVIKIANEAKKNSRKGYMLELLAKIRDISLYPDLGITNVATLERASIDEVISKSARLAETFAILDDVKNRNEKALVFTISRKMQIALKSWIEKKYHINVMVPISGAVGGEKRQKIIDAFEQTTGFNVLILSPEAGGVGFNITSANNVIHLSRCWNPAKEDQATDRAYRIGQKKDVNVYIPLAINPNWPENKCFDSKLDKILDYKRHLSENVFYPMTDSEKDGINMMNDLTSDDDSKGEEDNDVLTLSDMAGIDPIVFEHVVADVWTHQGYATDITPPSNDHGADVIVWENIKKKEGMLIQCKQTSRNNNCGPEGVQEVCCAVGFYEHKYNAKFSGCVVTNANDFTVNAKASAKSNKIRLVSGAELGSLLDKYKIKKTY